MEAQYVGEILVRHGALTPEKLQTALSTVAERGLDLKDVLIATDACDEEDFVKALAAEAGLRVQGEIKPDEVDEDLIALVPITFARQHRVLPLSRKNGMIQVAVSDPLDLAPLDDLRVLLGAELDPIAVPGDRIEDAINRVYERAVGAALDEAKEGEEDDDELQDLIDMTDEAPVIRWVNNLFYTALRERASDIHIEPTDSEVVVRYRVDGRLSRQKSAHRGFLPSIVSRVKIEAGLNIAEKRLPQDGRITKKIAGKLVDVRVSTIPTAKGERIVMRLLDKENILLELTDLGFDPQELGTMHHLIERPNGIILVTGPTGSGKTTTLYACLNRINTEHRNILTAEDPVEYELKGIGQVQTQKKINLTFASAMRAFLRQDPDVIMVGEIRDHETAEIAIHASLTGHLVLSTLHTNDAPTAVTRLVDMGVQPFQISSSVLAVLAQRLVRRLCPFCRIPYEPSEANYQELGLDPNNPQELLRLRDSAPMAAPAPEPEQGDDGLSEFDFFGTEVTNVAPAPTPPPVPQAVAQPSKLKVSFYKAGGCDECSGLGYRGRVGIYELMVINEAIRREILANSDSNTIMKVAARNGMRTLREDGARKVLTGQTSVEEVLAATQAGDLEIE